MASVVEGSASSSYSEVSDGISSLAPAAPPTSGRHSDADERAMLGAAYRACSSFDIVQVEATG